MTTKPTYEALEQRIRVLEDALTKAKQAEEELRQREAKYRFLMGKMTDTIWTLDMDMRPTYVSPSSIKVLGYSPKERLKQHLSDMVTPETYARVTDLLAREREKEREGSVDPDRTISIEMEYYHKDGHTVWLENKVSAVRARDGHMIGLHGVSRDITDRKRVEDMLRESEERFRQISHLINDVMYSCATNKDGVFSIDWMSGNTEEMTGYTIDEIKAQSCWRFLVREEDVSLFDEKVVGIPLGQSLSVDLRIRHKNGETTWVTSYAECTADAKLPGGKRLYGRLVDITERKRANEALRKSESRYRELSIVDDLTQLYNVRHFYNQLTMEINRADRYGQPLTLLFLDLDDFKHFNDVYGHVKGDEVLVRLGQVVKRQLRQTDSAYRYGGEEFTILLPMTTRANGTVTAERIRKEFKKEIFSPVKGKDVHMTVSIGIAQYKPGEGGKILVHRVDQLMYQAKKSGKDRVCSESWPQEHFNGQSPP